MKTRQIIIQIVCSVLILMAVAFCAGAIMGSEAAAKGWQTKLKIFKSYCICPEDP